MPNISNAARDIPLLFKADLEKDEKILWHGRPEPQLFTAGDIIAIPFSLLWGGFAYFWEGTVVYMYLKDPVKHAGLIFFMLWGIPFVCIGSYMIFGRFIYQRWQQKNTFYAVTNRRILILNTARGRTLQAVLINPLSNLTKHVNKKGAGSIIFGGDPRLGGLDIAPSGPVFGRRSRVPIVPAFINVKDVDKVYELITRQQKQAQ